MRKDEDMDVTGKNPTVDLILTARSLKKVSVLPTFQEHQKALAMTLFSGPLSVAHHCTGPNRGPCPEGK